MKNRTTFVWLIIVSFVATLVVNFLATNLPLNNLTTEEISDSFDIYFVPAGYVFSIWGLIYLGLLGFVIYQALPKNRSDERLAKIDFWFVISCIANALWLVSFHYLQFVLALVFMLVLLVSLIIIFVRLEIGKRHFSGSDQWLVNVPFSIYLGWITVATIANVTQVLDYVGWNGFGIAPEIWLVIMLAVAVLLAAVMSFTRRNIPYALVLIWSFIGIAVKFPQPRLVNIASWAAAAAVVLLLIISLLTGKKVED